MNPIIKDQLERCRVAKLPYYDEDTTTLMIPKGSAEEVNPYQVHKCYLLQLEEYIVNPPPDFSLHTNWNNGIKPVDKCMKAYVIQDIGKMVKLKCIGFNVLDNKDLNTNWTGWCPKKSIKIIKEIDVE